MKFRVENLCEKEVLDRGIRNWPHLEKEAFLVDWYYDSIQDCLMLDGEILVEIEAGKIEFRKLEDNIYSKENKFLANFKNLFHKKAV
jgi:hypothetical protein